MCTGGGNAQAATLRTVRCFVARRSVVKQPDIFFFLAVALDTVRREGRLLVETAAHTTHGVFVSLKNKTISTRFNKKNKK